MTRRELLWSLLAASRAVPLFGQQRVRLRTISEGGSPFNWITDKTITHPPPTTGPYAYSPPYGTFTPNVGGFPAVGSGYTDPVFGTSIRRMTADYPNGGAQDTYSKNGWWTADSSYFVNTFADGSVKAVKATDGTTKTLINNGFDSRVNASCSPVDADVFYYYQTTQLKKMIISTGSASVVKDFGSTLGNLGGTLDWISNDDRYMLLKVGGFFRVWDKQTDTLFTGSIDADIGGSYVAITPDARYVIRVGVGVKDRYAINTSAQTLATSPTSFYAPPFGDHGDVMLASDGNLYFIAFDNDRSPPAAHVRINVETGAVVDLHLLSSDAFWANHITGVSLGSRKDWCFFSTEYYGSNNDDFDAPDPVASWLPGRNELYAINILTGAFRRVCHHRSRLNDDGNPYNVQARPSVSWDGTRVAWASNYGYQSSPEGYADLWVVDIPAL